MKHLLSALILVTLFAISCSGDTTEQPTNSTIENTETTENSSTASTTPESDNALIAENLDNETIEEVVADDNNNTNSAASETVEINTTSRGTSNNSSKTNNTNTKPVTTTETNEKKPNPKPLPKDLFAAGNGSGHEPIGVGSKVVKDNPKPNNAGGASSTASDNTSTKPGRPTLSHESFDELLRKYVSSSGGVDYDGLKRNKKILDQYLELLKNNAPSSSWSKNKEMAYWINMYNAFTIQAILEKYPVNSITDLEGGKVWDKRTIVVGGKSLTLNNIEKDKLLKRFKEPRVHFAVNCAAKSCPPLLNKAWTEDNIQRYLEKQAKAFINNSKENTLSAKKIQVSQIFNWYAGDFGGSDKIVAFFQKYSDTDIKSNAKVEFKDYNWSLNKK